MDDKFYKFINIYNVKNILLRRSYIIFLAVVVVFPLFILCCGVEGFKGARIYIQDVIEVFQKLTVKGFKEAWKKQ